MKTKQTVPMSECATCHVKFPSNKYHVCLPAYSCCLGSNVLEFVEQDATTVYEHGARAAAEVYVDEHVTTKKSGVPVSVLVRHGILVTICEVVPFITTSYKVNQVSVNCMLTDDMPDNPKTIFKMDVFSEVTIRCSAHLFDTVVVTEESDGN